MADKAVFGYIGEEWKSVDFDAKAEDPWGKLPKVLRMLRFNSVPHKPVHSSSLSS